MKKITFLALLLVACISLSAKQSSYTVYEYRGDVLCKKSGVKQWTPVERNTELSILDSLSISADGYVRVREEPGDAVYRSVSTGKMRVMDLVVMARKQSRQRVEMQVNDNIRRTMNQTEPAMNVYGTGTRTMEEADSLEAAGTFSQDTIITIQVSKEQLEQLLEAGTLKMIE